jgi:transcriptional regulator with XRE-family HTH domain
MPTDLPPFAETFERLRVARGWKPAEVARRLGVYPTEVSRWRRGLGGISIKNVRKVADLFEVDRAWLEGLAGYPEGECQPVQDDELLAITEALKSGLLAIPRLRWPAVTQAWQALASIFAEAPPLSAPESGRVSVSDGTQRQSDRRHRPRLTKSQPAFLAAAGI